LLGLYLRWGKSQLVTSRSHLGFVVVPKALSIPCLSVVASPFTIVPSSTCQFCSLRRLMRHKLALYCLLILPDLLPPPGLHPVIVLHWLPNSSQRLRSSAKKPFSQDVSSPRPDEASPLFASRPCGSPEPSLPFISFVWCARTPHFPSKASDALFATPPPPSAFQLYLPPYLLVYRPPAYSYQLRASGGCPRSPLTCSDLDLSAPVR